MDLHPYLFCLSFYLLYFFLPPFDDNGLFFWVTDVLYQHSEVVLWNLISVQMFFRWICGGERGLPILFLRHLPAAPSFHFLDDIVCRTKVFNFIEVHWGIYIYIYIYICPVGTFVVISKNPLLDPVSQISSNVLRVLYF